MKRIVFFLLILSTAIGVAYYMNLSSNTQDLPIINPTDLKPEMVDSSIQNQGREHTIGAFRLTDEKNRPISDSVVNNKVFVAEYFFTTCGSICPIMNQQMQRIQAHFKGNEDFEILSFTVDPEHDNPEALLDYARKHNYVNNQWHFITGPKKDLYALARKSFFVLKPAEAQNLGDAGSDFIHTNNFVLVDKKRRIRGYYDGTNANEVNQLIKDIELLLAPDGK